MDRPIGCVEERVKLRNRGLRANGLQFHGETDDRDQPWISCPLYGVSKPQFTDRYHTLRFSEPSHPMGNVLGRELDKASQLGNGIEVPTCIFGRKGKSHDRDGAQDRYTLKAPNRLE